MKKSSIAKKPGSRAVAALFLAVLCLAPGQDKRAVHARDGKYAIGDRGPAGGWIFYDRESGSGGWRYLEAAPGDQGEAPWGCRMTVIPGAKGPGRNNTEAIIKSCAELGIAARLAEGCRAGGKSDWFLPSRDELNSMYRNLHARKKGGFARAAYWSSSQLDEGSAWAQDFSDGGQSGTGKDTACFVRAIRAF